MCHPLIYLITTNCAIGTQPSTFDGILLFNLGANRKIVLFCITYRIDDCFFKLKTGLEVSHRVEIEANLVNRASVFIFSSQRVHHPCSNASS